MSYRINQIGLCFQSLNTRRKEEHILKKKQLIVGNLASFFKTREIKHDKKVSKGETLRELGSESKIEIWLYNNHLKKCINKMNDHQ